MLSNTVLFFSLIVLSSSIELCFSSYSYTEHNCKYHYLDKYGVTSNTNFTKLIRNVLSIDSNFTIWLEGDFSFRIPLNLFNNKTVQIKDKGTFLQTNVVINISEIENVSLSVDVSRIEFIGNFTDDQSSLSLKYRTCSIPSKEGHFKSLVILNDEIHFTKIYTNNFTYKSKSGNVTLSDDNMVNFSDQMVEFPNDNLALQLVSFDDLLIINNITKKSYISSISLNNIKEIEFQGNEYKDSISLMISNCKSIITNITYLEPLSFEFLPNVQYNVTLMRSVVINEINLPCSTNITFKSAYLNQSSRFSVKLNSFAIENGTININSSWIDLITDSFSFNSLAIPIQLCVGSGGSSTFYTEDTDFTGNKTLWFDSLIIQFDISGIQSDKSLSALMSKEWNMITFKSFNETVPPTVKTVFTGQIYGFGGEFNLFKVELDISDDYIIKANMSSYYTMPLLIDVFDDTNLSEVIPANAKIINLTAKLCHTIDLTNIPTKDAVITFNPGSYINDIITNEYTENDNVRQIIFDNCILRSGTKILKSKIIKFTKVAQILGYPNIIFSQNSEVDIYYDDAYTIYNYVNESFPLTRVHCLKSTNFYIDDDYYTIKEHYVSLRTKKFPKIIFHMNISDYLSEYHTLIYNTSASTIKNVTVLLESDDYDKIITVKFPGLSNIVTAENVGIDFGNFKRRNEIILYESPKKNYLTFKGYFTEVVKTYSQNSKLCACKNSSCDYCEDDYIQVSYEKLDQKVKDFTESKSVLLIVSGADGDEAPFLSLESIGIKDVNINGIGNNPRIQIDCSQSVLYSYSTIQFTNITVIRSSGNSFEVSHLLINWYPFLHTTQLI